MYFKVVYETLTPLCVATSWYSPLHNCNTKRKIIESEKKSTLCFLVYLIIPFADCHCNFHNSSKKSNKLCILCNTQVDSTICTTIDIINENTTSLLLYLSWSHHLVLHLHFEAKHAYQNLHKSFITTYGICYWIPIFQAIYKSDLVIQTAVAKDPS